MKVEIIDEQHFRILADSTELASLTDIDSLVLDTHETFVCVSGPSDIALANWVIKKEDISEGTLFNVVLTVPDTIEYGTDELLFIFLVKTDNSIYRMMPSYNPIYLLDYIADNSGLMQKACSDCNIKLENAHMLLLYYGFKMAISTQDYKSAIWFWNRIFKTKVSTIARCNCN